MLLLSPSFFITSNGSTIHYTDKHNKSNKNLRHNQVKHKNIVNQNQETSPKITLINKIGQ